jgi:hypothetical protein
MVNASYDRLEFLPNRQYLDERNPLDESDLCLEIWKLCWMVLGFLILFDLYSPYSFIILILQYFTLSYFKA